MAAAVPIKSVPSGDKSVVEAEGKTLGNYIIGKTLGEGTFGKVKVATHIPTGEKVAIKVLEKNRIKEPADIVRVKREIKILKKVRHRNIIQLYEVMDTKHAIYLVMEHVSGGELFDYIVAHKHVQEKQACKFFHQIVDGLDDLHKSEVTHRDLKPENLLLKQINHEWVIKIVDFGLSNTHEGGRLLSTACGSPCYAAPEMIAGKKYQGPIIDIWSLGVVLFALVAGYLPFEDPNTSALYKKILSGDYKPPKFLSAEVKDLISRILETDPRRRYSIDQIKQHPWYLQVPESSVPKDWTTEEERLHMHLEGLRIMEEAGTSKEVLMDALRGNLFNAVTATYYLLEQKQRNKLLSERQPLEEPKARAKEREDPKSGSGAKKHAAAASNAKPKPPAAKEKSHKKAEKRPGSIILRATTNDEDSRRITKDSNEGSRRAAAPRIVEEDTEQDTLEAKILEKPPVVVESLPSSSLPATATSAPPEKPAVASEISSDVTVPPVVLKAKAPVAPAPLAPKSTLVNGKRTSLIDVAALVGFDDSCSEASQQVSQPPSRVEPSPPVLNDKQARGAVIERLLNIKPQMNSILTPYATNQQKLTETREQVAAGIAQKKNQPTQLVKLEAKPHLVRNQLEAPSQEFSGVIPVDNSRKESIAAKGPTAILSLLKLKYPKFSGETTKVLLSLPKSKNTGSGAATVLEQQLSLESTAAVPKQPAGPAPSYPRRRSQEETAPKSISATGTASLSPKELPANPPIIDRGQISNLLARRGRVLVMPVNTDEIVREMSSQVSQTTPSEDVRSSTLSGQLSPTRRKAVRASVMSNLISTIAS